MQEINTAIEVRSSQIFFSYHEQSLILFINSLLNYFYRGTLLPHIYIIIVTIICPG
jgi:hypothetical protein